MQLALRGLRNLDDGNEKIGDFTVRLALRRRAYRMWAITLAISAVLTVAFYFI